MWHPILIKQSNTRANSNTNTKLWDMCAIVHRSNLTLWSWWGKELSQGGGFPYFQHQGRYNSTHSLKKSSLCRLSLTNPFSSSPFNVFTVQYAMTFWQKTPQIHKYTNTRIHEYTNTQIQYIYIVFRLPWDFHHRSLEMSNLMISLSKRSLLRENPLSH